MSAQQVGRFFALALFLSIAGAADPFAASSVDAAPDRVRSARMPVHFEANRGQVAAPVRFLARVRGFNAYFSPDFIDLELSAPNAHGSPARLRLSFEGATPGEPRGVERLNGRVNYVRGADPAGWTLGVPVYGRLRCEDLYPGMDAEYYASEDGTLEYDLRLAPWADPGVVRLRVTGAEALALDAEGNLRIQTPAGALLHRRPVAFQQTGGVRQMVDAKYVLHESGLVGIALGAYDRTRPLTIDPVIVYSTYLGGPGATAPVSTPGHDSAERVAADAAGHAYVTGSTQSLAFPVTAGAYAAANAGGTDAFLARFDASGALVYATYLGGSEFDAGQSVAVDALGAVAVVGETASIDFPVLSGYQTLLGGPRDAFVTVFDSAGVPVYSSYLGGGASDVAEDVAMWGGHAYLVGVARQSTGAPFPTVSAFDSTLAGNTDLFVAHVDPAAAGISSLVYSTLVGGSGDEFDFARAAIAVDSTGRAHVAGVTNSDDLPATAGAYRITCTNCLAGRFNTDLFIARLSPAGNSLEYLTYFGGIGRDSAGGLALDPSGAVYITGITSTPDFPVTAGSVQDVYLGGPYRSVDGGASWSVANDGLTNTRVAAFAIVPLSTGGTALIAGAGDGLFRSVDGGLTWQDVNVSNTGIDIRLGVRDLANDPTEPGVVYAALNSGSVQKSTDGGQTWTWVGDPTTSGLLVNWVEALAIGAATPVAAQTIYAGGLGSHAGIYVSTDGGASWSPRIAGLGVAEPFIQAIAVQPSGNPQIAYASRIGTSGGVYRTESAGASWTAVNSGLPSPTLVLDLAVDPRTDLTAYAGTSDEGVYKTVDGGALWSPANAGIETRRVTDLAIDPGDADTVYAATDEGLFVSTDGGVSWNGISSGLRNRHMGAVFVDPASPLRLHAASLDDNRAFAAKLRLIGGGAADLVYSTFIGGTGRERGWDVAVDASSQAHVVGQTESADFPLVDPVQPACLGVFCSDAFLAKLSASGGGYVYSTYFGGAGSELGLGVALAGSDVLLVGVTSSDDLPTVSPAQPARAGGSDAFVARIAEGSDTTPPTIGVSLSPSLLWPPTRRLETITATVVASDDGPAPTIRLVSIVSSDPDTGRGRDLAEDVQNAAIGTDDRTFDLRAERSSRERVYTVTYAATDAAGNTATASATVRVAR